MVHWLWKLFQEMVRSLQILDSLENKFDNFFRELENWKNKILSFHFCVICIYFIAQICTYEFESVFENTLKIAKNS